MRSSVGTAITLTVPCLQEGQLRGVAAGRGLHVARRHVLPHHAFAAVVDGLEPEAVVLVERLGHDMGERSGAVGRGRDLAVPAPGGELLDVLYRDVLVDRGRQVPGVEPCDQREVLVRIVGQLLNSTLF